jgi:PAS domain S-box-containing protein
MTQAQPRTLRWGQIAALAIAGVCLSFATYQLASRTDADRVRASLELRAEWRARDIERKLAFIDKGAAALAIYLAAEGNVSAKQFHAFARLAHTQGDFDGALDWYPWVQAADRPAFVAAARREVDPDFDIREIGPAGRFIAAAERPHYVPQLYQEIFDQTPGLAGLDLLSRPEREVQVLLVRDSGRPLASAPAGLLSGDPRGARFVALWPVYATGDVPASLDARRAAFRGVATARFQLDRLLPGLIADTPGIIEAIDIAVGADGDTPRHLASFDPARKAFVIGEATLAPPPDSVAIEREFSVLGQRWELRSYFAADSVAALTSTAPWAWAVFGLLITISLVFLASRQAARLEHIEGIASETDDRFRRLFDENPIGMVLATADDYRYLQVNAAFCNMLGYTQDELLGHARDEFAALDPQNPPTPDGAVSDPGWNATDRHYASKSGKTIITRVRTMRLAPTATGEVLLLKLVEDVTDQRKLEETLRQAQKMEAIGQLTGGMAHDFNNLLGIIIGNLDLLQPQLPDGGDAAELLDEAVAAALRGADLTQSLLAFARRQPLNPNRIAPNEQVSEIARLLTRTLGERISISLDLATDIWPVMADANQLEACIINLATNARDAMPNGGALTIATGNRRLDADYAGQHADVRPGDYAMIEVSDTGSGMPPQIMAQIFEPFFTTKGPGKGTGLGLSMVFGFLKQSNGHVSAYSEPGIGTTFRLYLPRAGTEADGQRGPATVSTRRGNGETVLVVEDSTPLRRVVARQMRDLGYGVIEADGADAALDVLARQPVALVFTDVVMPGELDGFGLARDIQARWPATKVLLTSGFPETKISRNLEAIAGTARLLGKPYRSEDLARILREVLEAPPVAR